MRTRTLLRSLLAQDPTCISFYAPIFQSLTGQNLLKLGQQVHAQMALSGLEPNAFLGAKMVVMYASSDDLASACDMYVGTCLIDMYVKCGEMSDARSLFDKMTVRDFSSWNALIAGNMKDGEICFAEDLFRRMPCKNIVSWTAIISGYTQNGLAEQTG
ncbi:pentatricopeptide repeat-containing protein [Prunus yedoensis var. nudiflora]|uniref:Pentatricopeptide repeat-containing protein n=1 Tax=Prunus yedoensis var. nudiflora TaxID=2094558 RepID=A0A314YJW9_PRUYE|nr:pentatricopeptide repeat-containing protein [Prunus yedoensis var. nudiflora]